MLDWVWDRLYAAVIAPTGRETHFESDDEENPFRDIPHIPFPTVGRHFITCPPETDAAPCSTTAPKMPYPRPSIHGHLSGAVTEEKYSPGQSVNCLDPPSVDRSVSIEDNTQYKGACVSPENVNVSCRSENKKSKIFKFFGKRKSTKEPVENSYHSANSQTVTSTKNSGQLRSKQDNVAQEMNIECDLEEHV